MPDDMETRVVHGPQPGPPANQSWIARKERFLRALFMISVYVFGVLFLISVLALGAFALATGILLGLVLAAAIGIVVLRFRNRWG